MIDIAKQCVDAIKRGNMILVCGNGGSAAQAQHFAAELVVRYKKNRRALPCIALTADTAILTACANDLGYEQVFARQLEAYRKPGDVLLALSTSGKSVNVNNAIQKAHEIGIHVLLSECGSLSGPRGVNGLIVRSWTCSECGDSHGRDVNAARNILTAARWSPSTRGNESSPHAVASSRIFRPRETGKRLREVAA